MDILGTESTETLFGTESSDNIFGFAGLDTLQALGGDDAIFGNQDNDWIDCGQGFDTVYGGKNDDFILGGFDDDYLRGDLESDEIQGEDGEDSLFGGKFPDTLIGGNGNDNLYGDLGSDILTGGEGADFFWLRPEGEGTDEITDYQDGVDSLMLPDDLTFNDLIIQPGNGNQTIISIANTGEQLVILENVSSDNVTEADFGAIISQTEESTISFSNAVDLGNLDGTQTQSDAVGDNNPINFYRFTLDAPKDLNLQLQGLSADADLYLIEDVNGNNLFDQGLDTSEVIDSSVLSGNEPESINFTQLATGTYFVGVSQFEGETNYDLTLTATGFTARSDGAGDTPEAALNIGVLQAEQTFQDFVGSSDANDYYKFTLNGISDFNLSLENLSADADVKLTDSTGNEIDFSANAGNNSETIQSLGLQAGDYYLQVYSFTGDTDYNLIVSADPVVVIPPDLAGNTREDAKDISALSIEQIFNDFVGNVDVDDYYKFTLDKNADFQLKLDQLTANADVELLDEQGQLMESSANADDQSETITQGLNAGTYFVHVLQKEGDSNYQLSLSAAEQLPPPDPGSTLETAVEQDSPVFSINGTVSGDKPDHFVKFTVNESGVFTANLSGLTADADVRLIADYNNDGQINPVEDRNGNQFVDDQEIEVLGWLPERNTNNESIRAFVQPGTYYLEVDSVDQQATNYTVDTTFNPSVTDPLAFDIQFNYPNGEAGLEAFKTGLKQAAETWERVISYSSLGKPHTLEIDVYPRDLGFGENGGVLANAAAGFDDPNSKMVWHEIDLQGKIMPIHGKARININPAALNSYKTPQDFQVTMTHELGHVLGLVETFSFQNQENKLIITNPNDPNNPFYDSNKYAGFTYGELLQTTTPTAIPLEPIQKDKDVILNEGSHSNHWAESKFKTELMTPVADLGKPMPLSELTIASLRDLGWNVNYGAAEPFSVA